MFCFVLFCYVCIHACMDVCMYVYLYTCIPRRIAGRWGSGFISRRWSRHTMHQNPSWKMLKVRYTNISWFTSDSGQDLQPTRFLFWGINLSWVGRHSYCHKSSHPRSMFWLKWMPKTYKKPYHIQTSSKYSFKGWIELFKLHHPLLLKFLIPTTILKVNSLGRHYLNEETTAVHQNIQKPYA